MEFQQATLSDLEPILSLFKEVSLSLKKKKVSQWSYWQDPPKDKIEWVIEGLKKNEFYFVLNEVGEKTGLFRLLIHDTLYWDKKGMDTGVRYIHSLVVKPEFTGLRIGETVLKKVIDDLKDKGVAALRLDCDASNKRLCDYYKGFGFKKAGSKKTKYSVNNLYELTLL